MWVVRYTHRREFYKLRSLQVFSVTKTTGRGQINVMLYWFILSIGMESTVTSCRLGWSPQSLRAGCILKQPDTLKTAVGLTGSVTHRAVTLVDMPFKVHSHSINQSLATFLVVHQLPEISGLHFSHFACHYWERSLLICLCKSYPSYMCVSSRDGSR